MNGWPKEKRDAYIAARTAGEWKRSPFTNIPFDSYVYREVLTKGEAEEIAEREEIEPELVDWSVLGEVDRCAVRIARVKAKIARERAALAAAKGDEAARQRVTQAGVNLKALDEELVWLRHQRSLAKADGGTGGGWFEEIRALLKEVVKILAEDGKSDEESIMSRLMECGGVDFLVAGAAGFPKDCGAWLPRAAARAVAFMMDPEDAVMFPTEPWLRKRKKAEDEE